MSETIVDAGTLAGAYLVMARLFSYPDPESWKRLAGHGLIDPSLTSEIAETEYLATFEVGRDTPPVPLFEGMHRGDLGRDGIMEDLMRFYEFFDVKLSETDREYPDHLVTELEFMAWLCLQEQRAQHEGRDAGPFRCAQRDFLSRHLAAWLPRFRQRLETSHTAYVQYGPVLGELVDVHQSWLNKQSQESEKTQ
ncbi:MAG: molecular chaperone TorD family protein [Nitrospiraceae bacterium]|nr:molecular chaperone TorD family protein [Nitrospiraceae bacterium]MDA8089170.1 molecular chaperone TorD family protein [Nitrospiraceae bacterium]